MRAVAHIYSLKFMSSIKNNGRSIHREAHIVIKSARFQVTKESRTYFQLQLSRDDRNNK